MPHAKYEIKNVRGATRFGLESDLRELKEKAAFVKDAVEDLYADLDADLHPDARTAEVKATLETHLTQFAIAVWGWKP